TRKGVCRYAIDYCPFCVNFSQQNLKPKLSGAEETSRSTSTMSSDRLHLIQFSSANAIKIRKKICNMPDKLKGGSIGAQLI
ncbi:MAG: hypothetical protein KGI19_11045, partial [Thaumarchaeota archaeon]|nr:hypothetical protein [Nitrososphaerota archaeon]